VTFERDVKRTEKTMGASRQLLDRYVESYNAGDLDAVMDLYAEDAVQTTSKVSSPAYLLTRDG
jgi:ketosteroid isomerase-like protein